jgi:hypothetical protein
VSAAQRRERLGVGYRPSNDKDVAQVRLELTKARVRERADGVQRLREEATSRRRERDVHDLRAREAQLAQRCRSASPIDAASSTTRSVKSRIATSISSSPAAW